MFLEYDAEYNVKANISYQHGSVQKGWNDPPALKRKTGDESSLEGISNPEASIVGALSNVLAIVKRQVCLDEILVFMIIVSSIKATHD